MRLDIDVKTSGGFFSLPARAVQEVLEASVRELTEKGEEHLKDMLQPRPQGVYLSVQQARPGQYSKGEYRRSVHSDIRGMRGTTRDNKVYGPWLEGVSSRNQATRFKGYGMWRRTRTWLEGHKRGIVEHQINRLIQGAN